MAFVTRGLRHTRVHVGVLVRLAGDGGLEVVAGLADRQAGRRVAAFFEIFEVAMRVAGFTFGSGTEHRGDVIVAFHVGLRGKVQITTIGLRFTGERGLEVALGLGTLQSCHCTFSYSIKYQLRKNPKLQGLLRLAAHSTATEIVCGYRFHAHD